MSAGTKHSLNFRGAMFGYNKADVDSYVERTESELEIRQTRYVRLEQQIGQMTQETDRAKEAAGEKAEEARLLTQQNADLRRAIRELEERLSEKDRLHSRTQEENRQLRQQLSESGADPKTIQEAILNAQRMSGILLEEAREASRQIRLQTEEECRALEDSSRETLEQAQLDAQDMIRSARLKCEGLQRDYDQVLMDVTLFKTRLLQMYREHMERLLALPEKETAQLPCVADTVVVEERPAVEETPV